MKPLCTSVTSSELEERFAKYGLVLSCRVVIDENHKSLGYGFVVFDTELAAKLARRSEQDLAE